MKSLKSRFNGQGEQILKEVQMLGIGRVMVLHRVSDGLCWEKYLNEEAQDPDFCKKVRLREYNLQNTGRNSNGNGETVVNRVCRQFTLEALSRLASLEEDNQKLRERIKFVEQRDHIEELNDQQEIVGLLGKWKDSKYTCLRELSI